MNTKTCLVTGGAGFLGSNLVDRLIHEHYRVVVVDNLSTGKKEHVNPKAVFYKADILDLQAGRIFKKENPYAVFHFAAHIEARRSVIDPVNDAKENILGTLSILEHCRKNEVQKIIFASSGGEIYGRATTIPTPETYEPDPISPYGVAKLAAEKYLNSYKKLYAISPLILRLANVYGPRQNPKGEAGVVAIFISAMLEGNKLYIHGDGKQTKDYIFIYDVVDAIFKAFAQDAEGVFNVGTQRETSVNEIFSSLRKLTGSTVQPIHTPPPPILFERGALSIKKAKQQLRWNPVTPLQEGLRETVAWFKK